MVGNNPGNNKSWSELVPRRLVSLPTPTSLTVEPAREEGTLCKKHHQRREQHELNTDNVDKYMSIELVLRELTHHGQRRMAAPVVSIRAQTLTQLVPAPVLKDVRRHEQPTWIAFHATVAAAGARGRCCAAPLSLARCT